MYKIVLDDYAIAIKARNILATDEEFKDIVVLSQQGNYKIDTIEYLDVEEGKDFLEEIKGRIKPKNLKFGKRREK